MTHSEWPPANYRTMAEDEEMVIDDSAIPFPPLGTLTYGGIIENGEIVYQIPDYPACMNHALHIDELCHHGLSLWLCADPINHYPPDWSY